MSLAIDHLTILNVTFVCSIWWNDYQDVFVPESIYSFEYIHKKI